MKCENILVYLEGYWPSRVRARLHTRRCESCRRAVEQWTQCKQALAEHPPLSEAARRAWMSAAVVEVRAAPRPAVLWWACATAVALCMGMGLWALLGNPRDDGKVIAKQRRPAAPPGHVAEQRVSPPRKEADSIATGLRQLSRDLDSLRSLVETLDERRSLDGLVAVNVMRFEP